MLLEKDAIALQQGVKRGFFANPSIDSFDCA
jgi:hypothetical protein